MLFLGPVPEKHRYDTFLSVVASESRKSASSFEVKCLHIVYYSRLLGVATQVNNGLSCGRPSVELQA